MQAVDYGSDIEGGSKCVFRNAKTLEIDPWVPLTYLHNTRGIVKRSQFLKYTLKILIGV